MGIFSTTSPFDPYVERATSEKNTGEDWAQIMDICDRVKESNVGPRDCLKALAKRLNNENPRVVLQAITLLDACINNCGRKFLLEVASREFEQELRKHLTSARTHHKVSEKLRENVKKWAENDFKGDPQLSLIPALYNKLKSEGYDFSVQSDSPKKTVKYSNDPNVVNNKQEEDDIARAIQLSLQDSGSNGSTVRTSSLYPSASSVTDAPSAFSPTSKEPTKEPKKARALYDFEAAEDNEMTFKAGEIVLVTDDSDPNWWKGSNYRSEGLFPANFVTLDLNAETESTKSESKRVSFSEMVEVTEVEGAGGYSTPPTGEIDPEKIDRLLHLMHEADPTGERADDPELGALEEQVNAMAPTIDADLEQIDRKHARLTHISSDLVEALNLYHQLMRDNPGIPSYYGSMPKMGTGQLPGQYPYAPSPTPGVPPPPMFSGQQGGYPGYAGPTPAGPGIPLQYPPPGSLPPGSMPPQGSGVISPPQPLGPPQPPLQQAPQPQQQQPPPPGPQPPTSDFNQHPQPNSSIPSSGSSMMPSFGHFPPSSQFAPMPPQGQPLAEAIPSSTGPPPGAPAYPQPVTMQQPLI